ncbi:glycosyltransferase family 4 protein [Patescibacteria group bacterium]|nr:glycosyltransferase family 4 protein [Patescibacteria group bacterium]MBU0963452.1 glycosyltransferase family 4 protein [Patescibacteria group bacterium]
MKIKPNILIITQLFPNAYNPAIGTFIVDQLHALKQYFNITVITPYSVSLRFILSNKQKSIINDNGLEIYYIKYHPFWLSLLQWLRIIRNKQASLINKRYVRYKIIKQAKKLHNKKRFILVHGHEIYIGDEASLIGNILKIPSLITIHGLYPQHLATFGKGVLKQAVDNLKNMNVLICVSKNAANTYQKIVNKQIHIIPNGINIPSPKSITPYWQNVMKNKIVLMTIGSFVPEKRIEMVIQANHQLIQNKINNFITLIIGKGPKKKYYQELIQSKQLHNNVYIINELPPKQLINFMACCHVLIQPSVVESFSMVCLEAMSLKKPFICTASTGIAEYITNDQQGYIIDPDNQNQLLEKLTLLINDKQQREKMGQAGYLTAQTLTWDKIINKTIYIYRNLTNNG